MHVIATYVYLEQYKVQLLMCALVKEQRESVNPPSSYRRMKYSDSFSIDLAKGTFSSELFRSRKHFT